MKVADEGNTLRVAWGGFGAVMPVYADYANVADFAKPLSALSAPSAYEPAAI
jgi:hypothetical protein